MSPRVPWNLYQILCPRIDKPMSRAIDPLSMRQIATKPLSPCLTCRRSRSESGRGIDCALTLTGRVSVTYMMGDRAWVQ